jgi:hypothetical protein
MTSWLDPCLNAFCYVSFSSRTWAMPDFSPAMRTKADIRRLLQSYGFMP